MNWSPWSRSASPASREADQVAPGLVGVECSALEEDVRRNRKPCRLGEDLGDQEVDVGVGARFGELGRHRVCAEPRRDAASGADGAELGELGVAIEPVPGLRLERRRPRLEHPADMALERARELVGGRRTGRSDRREDPAAARVQLLVRTPPRS